MLVTKLCIVLQGLRAQIDRKQYKKHMQQYISSLDISIFEATVDNLLIKSCSGLPVVSGVCLGMLSYTAARTEGFFQLHRLVKLRCTMHMPRYSALDA